MKQIFFLLFLFSSSFLIVFGDESSSVKAIQEAETNLQATEEDLQFFQEAAEQGQDVSALQDDAFNATIDAERSLNNAHRQLSIDQATQIRDENCEVTGNCLDKPNFTITVNDISPGVQIDSDKTAKQNVEATFVTLIEKLIYAFGALAILIMTIGGGYMIMYNGQDELLSKGKSIFMAGIISVFVALGAGIIINLIRFILYA